MNVKNIRHNGFSVFGVNYRKKGGDIIR